MGRSSILLLAIVGLLAGATGARATCPSFHTLTNGITADASQVMDNFNYILQCPNFTGNVGINSSSPLAPLQVTGSGATEVLQNLNAALYAGMRIYNDTNSNSRTLEIDYAGSSYTGPLVSGGPAGESAAITTTGSYPLVLGTGNSARVTITQAGNVGIGTANPSFPLHVYAPVGSNAYGMIENGGTTDIAALVVRGATTSANWFFGTNRADLGGSAANLFLYNGTTTNKVVITPTGSVGIGTTSPGQMLQVVGTIRQSNCISGTLSANSSGDIICTSDARLKNILGPYEDGLKAIAKITPQRFMYKPTPSNPEETFVHAGFIAQNVMAAIPEATAKQRNGYYSLDATAVLAAAVNAIKELERENRTQADQIRELRKAGLQQETQIGSLKGQLAAMRSFSPVRTAKN